MIQQLVITCFGLRILVVIIITITENPTESQVTSFIIQFPVNLQSGISRQTISLGQRSTVSSIYTDIFQRIIGKIVKIQIIIRICHQIERIFIKGSRLRERSIIGSSIRKIRAKNNICQRIRFPLHTEVSIHVCPLIPVLIIRIRI